MGRNRAPWSAKIHEILEDGEWHRRDEVVEKAGPMIPPGRAMRVRESERQRDFDKRRAAGVKTAGRPERSPDYLVTVGRRNIIVDSISNFVEVETRIDDDGVAWYRNHRRAKEIETGIVLETLQEAEDRTGVARSTLNDRVRSGELASVGRRPIRVDPADVDVVVAAIRARRKRPMTKQRLAREGGS